MGCPPQKLPLWADFSFLIFAQKVSLLKLTVLQRAATGISDQGGHNLAHNGPFLTSKHPHTNSTVLVELTTVEFEIIT